MIDTDLPALARAVAEKLGVLHRPRRTAYGVWTDGPHPLEWLYSPEGAFWLIEVMNGSSVDIGEGQMFGEALQQLIGVGQFTPQQVLRAAAAALGVEA